jgi:hypothetical protein
VRVFYINPSPPPRERVHYYSSRVFSRLRIVQSVDEVNHGSVVEQEKVKEGEGPGEKESSASKSADCSGESEHSNLLSGSTLASSSSGSGSSGSESDSWGSIPDSEISEALRDSSSSQNLSSALDANPITYADRVKARRKQLATKRVVRYLTAASDSDSKPSQQPSSISYTHTDAITTGAVTGNLVENPGSLIDRGSTFGTAGVSGAEQEAFEKEHPALKQLKAHSETLDQLTCFVNSLESDGDKMGEDRFWEKRADTAVPARDGTATAASGSCGPKSVKDQIRDANDSGHEEWSPHTGGWLRADFFRKHRKDGRDNRIRQSNSQERQHSLSSAAGIELGLGMRPGNVDGANDQEQALAPRDPNVGLAQHYKRSRETIWKEQDESTLNNNGNGLQERGDSPLEPNLSRPSSPSDGLRMPPSSPQLSHKDLPLYGNEYGNENKISQSPRPRSKRSLSPEPDDISQSQTRIKIVRTKTWRARTSADVDALRANAEFVNLPLLNPAYRRNSLPPRIPDRKKKKYNDCNNVDDSIPLRLKLAEVIRGYYLDPWRNPWSTPPVSPRGRPNFEPASAPLSDPKLDVRDELGSESVRNLWKGPPLSTTTGSLSGDQLPIFQHAKITEADTDVEMTDINVQYPTPLQHADANVSENPTTAQQSSTGSERLNDVVTQSQEDLWTAFINEDEVECKNPEIEVEKTTGENSRPVKPIVRLPPTSNPPVPSFDNRDRKQAQEDHTDFIWAESMSNVQRACDEYFWGRDNIRYPESPRPLQLRVINFEREIDWSSSESEYDIPGHKNSAKTSSYAQEVSKEQARDAASVAGRDEKDKPSRR